MCGWRSQLTPLNSLNLRKKMLEEHLEHQLFNDTGEKNSALGLDSRGTRFTRCPHHRD
jgi:hypothetical protein